MIRRIRDLLYDQGFTISGARNKMQELLQTERDKLNNGEVFLEGVEVIEITDSQFAEFVDSKPTLDLEAGENPWNQVRRELFEIRDLLVVTD